MIRRPPRSTPLYSSAASDVYKRQILHELDCLGLHRGAALAGAFADAYGRQVQVGGDDDRAGAGANRSGGEGNRRISGESGTSSDEHGSSGDEFLYVHG